MQPVIKQQQEDERVCYLWSSDCVYGSSKNIKNSFVSMSDASLVCNYYQSYLLLLHTLQLQYQWVKSTCDGCAYESVVLHMQVMLHHW